MTTATLILIDVPQVKASVVKERVLACVRQTGDELIGYRTYDDGYVQLIVKLKHNDYIPRHQIVLGPALQAGAIIAFTFVTCYLVKVLFSTASGVQRLHSFPLRARETWFPAIDEGDTAYLCLTSRQLSRVQSDWLVATARLVQDEQPTEGIPTDLL